MILLSTASYDEDQNEIISHLWMRISCLKKAMSISKCLLCFLIESSGTWQGHSAYALAQAMHAQSNMDGIKYLLFDCFVDTQKVPIAINLDEQKAVHNGKEYLQFTTLD